MTKRVFLGLILLIGLAGALLMAQGQTQQVQVSLNAQGQIVVEPDRLEINLGDRVRFSSSGSGRDRLEIDFEYQDGTRGPFRSRDRGDNPSRGRYRKDVDRDITTESSDRRGEFKYTVFWIASGGQMTQLDPAIVVR